jgi:hypothetical protein
MKIELIEDRNLWNRFLDENNYVSFLQDFEYGEIERSLGREVIRLALKDKEILGVCQIIGYQGKRKGLVIHHGPASRLDGPASNQENFILEILKFLKENNYHKKYDFLRINPISPIPKIKGFILAPTYAVTENFWIKEIKNDEEMLEEMSETTRRLVLDSLKKPFLEIEKN